MQSKTTRSVRHLLVSTGVISLVLSVAAPAALADAEESKRGNGKDKDKGTDVEEIEEPAADRKVWVCHLTSSDENPWELNHVSVTAEGPAGDALRFPEQDLLADFKNKNDLLAELEAEVGEEDGETLDELIQDGCDAANSGGEGTGAGEGTGGGSEENGAGEGTGGGSEENGAGEGTGGGSEGNGAGEGTGGGSEGNGAGEGTGGGQTGNSGVGEGAGGGKTGNQGGGGGVIVDAPTETVEPVTGNPVVVVAPEVVEVPVKNAPVAPATPAQPIPAAQPRPVVNISTDTVTKPVVPATPASPAAAPKADQNEVLGAVTTRTPTPGVGALDPGTHTAASITALAATGADGTKVLAVAGVILLLSGFGLQVSGRRRMRSAVVGA